MQRLELYAGKLARTVLRGGWCSDALSLPDHNLVFYRGLAEVVSEYLKKGDLIYIEGELTTEKYEKNGEDRYITKIIVSDMKMLGGSGKAESDDHSGAKPASTAKPAKGAGKSSKSNSEPF